MLFAGTELDARALQLRVFCIGAHQGELTPDKCKESLPEWNRRKIQSSVLIGRRVFTPALRRGSRDSACARTAGEKTEGQDSRAPAVTDCHEKSYAQDLHKAGWKRAFKDCKLVALPKWRNSSVIQPPIEAVGHDFHRARFLGAILQLSSHKSKLWGTISIVLGLLGAILLLSSHKSTLPQPRCGGPRSSTLADDSYDGACCPAVSKSLATPCSRFHFQPLEFATASGIQSWRRHMRINRLECGLQSTPSSFDSGQNSTLASQLWPVGQS
jgi:hypothetical protein